MTASATSATSATDDELHAAIAALDTSERDELARHLYGSARGVTVEEWSRGPITTWLAGRVDRGALLRLFPEWPDLPEVGAGAAAHRWHAIVSGNGHVVDRHAIAGSTGWR